VLASPQGGQPPLDPTSDLPENQTEATKRFRTDTADHSSTTPQMIIFWSRNDYEKGDLTL
jgi:hypothetical protein